MLRQALAARGRRNVLVNRAYRDFWLSNIAWNAGRYMEQIVAGWLVLELTNSAFLVALIAFYRNLFLPVIGIPAGVLSDRWDRRRLVIGVQAANGGLMALLGALILLGGLHFWHVAAVELLMGICMALEWPSRRALTADLVARDELLRATTLDSLAQNGARVGGPLLAGVLYAWIGSGACFLVLAATYLVAGSMLARVRVDPSVIRSAETRIWKTVTEGIAYVVRDQAVLAVLIITVGMNFFAFPYQQLLSVMARDVIGVGSVGYGTLSAVDGLGSLVGALVIVGVGVSHRNGYLFILGAGGTGLFVMLFSQTRSFGPALVAMFLVGLARAGFSATQTTIVLRNANFEMRGRAMGVLTLAIGASPFGSLAVGAVADQAGVALALLTSALACTLVVAAVTALMPRIRSD